MLHICIYDIIRLWINQRSAKNIGGHCANWKLLYPVTDRHPEPDESTQCIRSPLFYNKLFFFILPSECVSSKCYLFFGHFLPKFRYVPLPCVLDASSQLTVKFYSSFLSLFGDSLTIQLLYLSLFGDSLTIQLLYLSIQFCWYTLSFTFKYFSCAIYFKHTHSNLLPQSETQNSLIRQLIVE